ncbi:MAG: polyketide cyclase [Crenarchaeota archaeon]|nr:polyketide cyclase [Thermoproteota archaeon]MDA1124767.1 polyketide cyclase [Thermoproteota archaeon]
MLKISFEREINADLEKSFDIITNFKNFQKLFPEFYPSILIKSVRDESSLVAEHLRLHDTEFIIMSKHFTSKPNSHEMRVIGGDIKGSSINEIFSFDNGKTLLKVTAELDVKSSRFSKKNPYGESLNDLYDAMIAEIGKS